MGYVVSTEDDFTDDLVKLLGREFKKAAIALAPASEFLEKIGPDASRPAIVMVLGHLEQTGTTGPVGPRIVLDRLNNEPSAWLVGRELTNRFRDAPWNQPHAIVMLMACESAATSAETLHDFVIAFHRARAAAIVGVECRAFSGLLSQFGADVTVALSKGTPLGQAMLDFRRKKLELGNPLAFVFTAIGCADIEIRRMGTTHGQKNSPFSFADANRRP